MFRNIIFIIAVAAVLITILFYFSLQEKLEILYQQSYSAKLEEKTIQINDQNLIVEIADERHEQAGGLSGRNYLDNDRGMLFIFPKPTRPEFWMKEMNFPLDIIWINKNNQITEIIKNLPLNTFPKTFMPSSPILYVLEVNAGWSDKNNIKIGDKISF